MLKSLRYFIVAVSCFLLFGSQDLRACMCGATSVCDAYSQAGAVVIAEVTDFRPANVSLDRMFEGGNEKESWPGQEVTLKVDRWFKGGNQRTIKLTQPNSTCDWSFDLSNLKTKYLFYLSFNAKYRDYSVVSCGRSAPLAKAFDDMSWLNGLPKSLKRTRISGTIKKQPNFSRLSNVKISIATSTKTTNILSDKNGLYQVWDLPVGKYHVTAETPYNLLLSWTSSVPENWLYFWNQGDSDPKALDITLESGRCAGIDFVFERK